MKLIKEIAFASALTLASLVAMPSAFAHEIKFGDLVISHPWSRHILISASGTGLRLLSLSRVKISLAKPQPRTKSLWCWPLEK